MNKTKLIAYVTIPEAIQGKTPIKGVDYWTEEDKQEIIKEIEVEVPSGSLGEWGEF